eukprot:CAMPEP_0175923784 /NCGR_PEP_ID=MMETSP0108-20121206/14755_1 /TAXON_ID=195067 ORGANISM="Goniomonas pacifica, Strain CCMP1869" /NCGR_SAMPLE_ID=MMETSP0108 /ASSEMBLY_ACC=CAM_ASM_000204 /LENGTH=49 /DNA_ID= /DNA_START= /DNA_END= /DNA_ORIENTATION=
MAYRTLIWVQDTDFLNIFMIATNVATLRRIVPNHSDQSGSKEALEPAWL